MKQYLRPALNLTTYGDRALSVCAPLLCRICIPNYIRCSPSVSALLKSPLLTYLFKRCVIS